jgi:hypothetical protein
VGNPKNARPFNFDDAITLRPRALYAFADLIVNVSGPLPPEIGDWPPAMQDQFYKALEKKNQVSGRKYEVLRVRCEYDVDEGWYVHVVIAAEIKLS